jgi:hypothetical protein
VFCAAVLLVLLCCPASATSASNLIGSGGTIQVGDLLFDNFRAAPQNDVDPGGIDVLGFTSSSGNFGLSFVPNPASAITSGGGNKIVADVIFDVRVTGQKSAIRDIDREFNASVSGNGIAAFDFTRVGQPPTLLSTVAANCLTASQRLQIRHDLPTFVFR